MIRLDQSKTFDLHMAAFGNAFLHLERPELARSCRTAQPDQEWTEVQVAKREADVRQGFASKLSHRLAADQNLLLSEPLLERVAVLSRPAAINFAALTSTVTTWSTVGASPSWQPRDLRLDRG